MGKSDYIWKKIKTSVLILAVLLSSFLLSGCEELQDLASDFVWIGVEHTLVAESVENEQIYKFRIDADVTNGFALDLNNVEISLSAPDNVEITGEGAAQQISENLIEIEETCSYSWIVQVPMVFEDQNIEYSVIVSSDESSEVIASGLLYVDGKNINDNRLDFNIDTWKFKNYGEVPIPLMQDDYDALMIGMDNASRERLKTIIANNSSEGYCYGMAATSILAKMGRLSASDINSSASNLHDLSKNDESKSAIGYYWITQFFSIVQDEIVSFMRMSTENRLKNIEEKTLLVKNGGTPLLLWFTVNAEGDGHAVVAYAVEKREFEWNGVTYDSRILIYDNNEPSWTEESCLYYNENSSTWCIPNYPEASVLVLALADLNKMDVKNLEVNKQSANSYITARNNSQLLVSSLNGEELGTVDGPNVQSNIGMVSFYSCGGRADNNLTIAIPKESINGALVERGYTIEPQEPEALLDLSILYENFYLSASSQAQDSISFDPEGEVEISGEATDFNISITANEGHYPTEWHTISVSGESAENLKVEISDSGYVLEGDDLEDITVSAENDETVSELELSVDEMKVLIAQDGDSLCAKTDEDDDGEYETIIVTGNNDTPDGPDLPDGDGFPSISFDGISSMFKMDSVDLGGTWVIVLIAGILMIAIIIAVIAVAVGSKKNKSKNKIEIPVRGVDEESKESKESKESIDDKNKDASSEKESIEAGITILSGANSGETIKIVNDQYISVGKDKLVAQAVIDSSYASVSRLHCTITYSDKFEKYYVTDCSSNGTYFETGERLVKGKRTPVKSGTVLTLSKNGCEIKLL